MPYQSAIKSRRGFVQPSPAFILHSRQRHRALVPVKEGFLLGLLDFALRLFRDLALLRLRLDPPTHLILLHSPSLREFAILALEPAQPLISQPFRLSSATLRSLPLRQGEQAARLNYRLHQNFCTQDRGYNSTETVYREDSLSLLRARVTAAGQSLPQRAFPFLFSSPLPPLPALPRAIGPLWVFYGIF